MAPRPLDVVIVGAGAAGIAAARRIAAAGRSSAVRGQRPPWVDAASPIRRFSTCPSTVAHTGSTCPTPIRCWRPPAADSRSIPRRARRSCASAAATRARANWRLFRRHVARRAIVDGTASRLRRPAAAERSRRLAVDRRVRARPFAGGKDLKDISALDLPSARARRDAFCRQGFGALLATLASGLPVQLSTPAIRSTPAALSVDTPKGDLLRAR